MEDSTIVPEREARPVLPPSHPAARNMVFDVANWHPKPVKRPRPVKSCTECRRRKLRCDRRCPCSQCQRSYRICKYGSGNNNSTSNNNNNASTGNSAGERHSDANNGTMDSEGSEGSDYDNDSAIGGPGRERPSKRHASRPMTTQHQQQQHSGYGHNHGPLPPGPMSSTPGNGARNPPPFNSSLSLLLNPPSPSLGHAAHASTSPSIHRPSGSGSNIPPAFHLPGPSSGSFGGVGGIGNAAANPQSPLLTLNGNELRQFTSALIDEFSARMERLEKLVLAKDASALAAMSAYAPASALSQLNINIRGLGGHGQRTRIIDPSSSTMRCLTVKGQEGLRTMFFGQSSTRTLLNLFDDAKDFMCHKARRETAGDLFSRLERVYTSLLDEHQHALKPITVYVDSMMPVLKRMADILPRREVCDRLFDAYVDTAEGLYRIIHVPTFRREYEAYWDNGGASTVSVNGVNGATTVRGVADDFLPRLLCVISIGSRFETESKGLCYDRSDGVHIPTACALVRAWLDDLRGQQMVNLHTLQAHLLLLHAHRIIAPRSINTWTELGLISRMAMSMGLHRDPTDFESNSRQNQPGSHQSPISPFQAEGRRKIWFTILDMDLHQAIACSLPNALRVDEYTCHPPRNLDDADLHPDMTELPPSKLMDQYTDGQMQVYAAGTLPLRMRANDLLCRLDALTDYSEVLAVGAELEKALDDINCLFPRNAAALGSKQKYKEWRMRALLDMHVRRPLLGLYRPFALSASDDYPPPPAINDVYLKSSMAMLTYMEELDQTTPGFDDVNHMYYVILRHDIVQAAFSVCFYIKQVVEAEASGSGGSNNNTANTNNNNTTTNNRNGLSPSSTTSGLYQNNDASVRRNSASPNLTANHLTPAGGSPSSAGVGGHSQSPAPASGPTTNSTTARKRICSPIWTAAYMIRTVERTVDNLARMTNDLSTDLRDVVALAVILGSVQPAASQTQRDEHIRAQVARVLDGCCATLQGHSSPAIRAAASGSSNADWYTSSLLSREKRTMMDESPYDLDFWDPWPIEPDQR